MSKQTVSSVCNPEGTSLVLILAKLAQDAGGQSICGSVTEALRRVQRWDREELARTGN